MPPSRLEILADYGIDFGDEDPAAQVLAHYGIPGMKWGVRRDRATLARLGGKEKSSSKPSAGAKDENAKAERRSDVKNARNLSDRDIRGKIDRLKLEAELRKLTDADLAPIRSKVTKLLSEAGWEVSKKVTVAALNVLAVKLLAGEKLTAKDIALYLQPGGKKK